MADFPLIFTGKDVSYEPRTTGELEKARDRFNKTFLEGEKYKAAERQRGEGFFYDTMDVSPVQLMSNKLTGMQEQGINDFNDKWASVFSKQSGTLTKAQQSEMFRDRKALETKQSQWLASQNIYERDWEIIKRDSQRANPVLDHDAFVEASEEYQRSGIYEGGLQYTPINPHAYFSKAGRTWTGSKDVRDVSKNVGDETHTYKVSISGTTEEARADIEAEIMNDKTGRLLRGVIEDFQSQPDDVKSGYLIEGEVDTPEEKNAIIRWAQDEYTPLLRKVDKSTKEKEMRAGDRLVGGRGVGPTGKTYFQPTDNVSGQFVGTGKGIEFNDAKPIDVLVDKLEFPEGVEISNASVQAYPMVAANGKVEFRIDPRGIMVTKKSKSSTEAYKNGGAEAVAGKDKDGFYTWEEKLPAGTRAAASIDDVIGDMNAHYGNDIFEKAVKSHFPDWGGDPDDKYLEK